MKAWFLYFSACIALIAAQFAHAGYNEGLAAYEKGDYQIALTEWQPLALQGDSKTQYGIGVMHDRGLGVSQNYLQAAYWFRLAAAQGNKNAQYNLGGLHFEGRGVPQDYTEAAKWYRLAAKQGNTYASFNLGYMYFNGFGFSRDYKQAAIWYRISAQKGLAVAQYNIGTMYFHGKFIAQNYSEAAKWLRLAANQGHPEAMNNLGALYGNGNGVPKNLIISYALQTLSLELGNTFAEKNIQIKIPNMTKEEIETANKLSDAMSQPGQLLKTLDAYQQKNRLLNNISKDMK